MSTQPIILIGNAHIDPVWLWKRCEGLSEIKSTFRSALDRMKEFPDYIFTCACASYYRWVETVDPAMFEEIRARVAEGRWSIVGGMWVQPDCNIPAGEAFVRHFLYSQRYFQEKFGRTVTVGYNVDSFGHNGMLPQLLRRAGIDAYAFTRPSEEEKPGLPNLFFWESPDGSRVTAFRAAFSYTDGCPESDKEHPCLAKLDAIRDMAEEQNLPFQQYYGVGNHGGGPSIRELTLLSGACREDLAVRFGSTREYFDYVAQNVPADRIPVVRDDLQHHASGCYSAHAGIKAINRRAENALYAAEAYDQLASLLLGTPPQTAAIRAAWEKLLFNQFHDVLAGCCIREACDEALDAFHAVCDAANDVTALATQRLSWNIRTTDILDHSPVQKHGWVLWEKEGKGAPYVVFNPHAFPIRIPLPINVPNTGVTDEEGNPVPVQSIRGPQTNGSDHYNTLFLAELPPLGYRTYYLYRDCRFDQPASDEPAPAAGERFLENEFLRAEFDPVSGALVRLLDKENGRELAAGPMARALVIDDHSTDTWAHGVFTFDEVVGEFGQAQLRVLETGPVRAALRVTSRYGNSTLVQDFSLSAGRRALDVRCLLNWQEPLKIVKLSFPAQVESPRAAYSMPYGFMTKSADGIEEPSHEWAGVYGTDGSGLALLNDGKYSVCAKENDLRMIAARSSIYADHFGERDDLVEYMDLGEQIFHYALMPYSQDDLAPVAQAAALLNRMPEGLIETHHDGALPPTCAGASVSAGNVLLGAIKEAEDGDGAILRLVETAGKAADCTVSIPSLGAEFTVAMGPQQVRTFRLPRDGGAPQECLLTEYPDNAG